MLKFPLIVLVLLCINIRGTSQNFEILIDNGEEGYPWGSTIRGITIDQNNGNMMLNVGNLDPTFNFVFFGDGADSNLSMFDSQGALIFDSYHSSPFGIVRMNGSNVFFNSGTVVEVINVLIQNNCSLPQLYLPGIRILDPNSGAIIEEYYLNGEYQNEEPSCFNSVRVATPLCLIENNLYVLVEVFYEVELNEQYGQSLAYCDSDSFPGDRNRMLEIRKYDLNSRDFEILNGFQVEKHRSTPAAFISDFNSFPFFNNLRYNEYTNQFESYFYWLNELKILSIEGTLSPTEELPFVIPIETNLEGEVQNNFDKWTGFNSPLTMSNGKSYYLFNTDELNRTKVFALNADGTFHTQVEIENDSFKHYAVIGEEVWLYKDNALTITSETVIKRFDLNLSPLQDEIIESPNLVLSGIKEYEDSYIAYGQQFNFDPSIPIDLTIEPEEPLIKGYLTKRPKPQSTSIVQGLENDIIIAPNPASDLLRVLGVLSEIESLTIYSFDGRLVIKSNNTNTIDISELASGTYFVNIKTNQGAIQSHKFLKQ